MKKIEDHFNEIANDYDRHFIEDLGMKEFYDEIQLQLENCKDRNNILVLGCGTGLELERIKFKSNVTAIDISSEMLKMLNEKVLYKDLNLNLICDSYFDIDYNEEAYDIVLSCYSFHHFSKEQKLFLYKKIYNTLKKSGCFINGDSTTKSKEIEEKRLAELKNIYKFNKTQFGSFHLDVHLTIKSEFELLKKAGFDDITIEKEWTVTTLIKAKK